MRTARSSARKNPKSHSHLEKKRQKQSDGQPEGGGLRLGKVGGGSPSQKVRGRRGIKVLLTLEKWGRRGANRRAGYKQAGL